MDSSDPRDDQFCLKDLDEDELFEEVEFSVGYLEELLQELSRCLSEVNRTILSLLLELVSNLLTLLGITMNS